MINTKETQYYIDWSTGKITYLGENVEKFKEENSGLKVAIVGSRSIIDEKFVNRILNAYKFIFGKPIKVISGGAKGIDTFGEKWADSLGIEKQIFLPDWDKYGKKAGYIRNEDIIKNCDICLAIWDGESKGTKNDFEWCWKYNKPVILFNMSEHTSRKFSGFYYVEFIKEDPIKKETKKRDMTPEYRRWLPQPGIIKM